MSEFEDLYLRAQRAFKGTSPTQAFRGIRNVVGPEKFPEGETLAEEGMKALAKGNVPTPAQIAALETVIKSLRPSVLSKNAILNDLPPYQNHAADDLTQWTTFKANVAKFLYSVGRIDQHGEHSTYEPLATGFIVRPGVLATNTHVLDALSAGWRKLERGQAVVKFGQEYQVVPDPPAVEIIKVIAVHPRLDVCLLEIDDTERPAFILDDDLAAKARRIAVIGYPQDDPRSPVFRDVIFQGHFGVKRAAPGEVRNSDADTVYHDCSTLGGNSGSPVVDMDTCKVVGIHRDGPLFMFRNEAVQSATVLEFVNNN